MSRDLRGAIRDAAPRPSSNLDLASVRQRARRITALRVIGAVAVVAIATAAALSLPEVWPERRELGPIGEEQGPPEVPSGPRYEVTSGIFGDDWGGHAGKRWRLLVWGEEDTTCYQLWFEGEENEGVSCGTPTAGHNVADTVFGGSISFFSQSRDSEQFQFVAGAVGPGVAALEFREEGARPLPIDLYDAPAAAGVPFRYYAAVLPHYDYADLVALDDRDEAVGTHNLCGPGCKADRAAEKQAKVDAYEQTPVTMDAKAGLFAIAAVGQAGLIDHFGTYYDYQGSARVDDSYDATFDVAQCPASAAGGGSYSCEPSGTAIVTFAAQGGRFVVSDAAGPMTPGQQQSLVGYSEAISSDGPGWRLVATSIAHDGDSAAWGIAYDLAWTGNIPAPVAGYGSLCSYRVYGSDGELLREARPVPAHVGSQEEERHSGLLSGVEGAGSTPEEIDVSCDDPRADPEMR